ncbi:MAG TPA: hypothetical protein VIS48_12965 [Candidatus Kryptonia bacterium]
MEISNSITVSSHKKIFEELGVNDAQGLMQELARTTDNLTQNSLRLAQIFYHIKNDELYLDMGFMTWEAFCMKYVKLSSRTVNSMIEAWGRYRGLPPDKQRAMTGIGWTKARTLLKVADGDNFGDLVKEAKRLTCDELQAKVGMQLKEKKCREISAAPNRTLNASSEDPNVIRDRSGEPEQLFNMNFKLYGDQYRSVVDALELASKMSHSHKPGYNLSLIALEFVATHSDAKGLKGLLALVEQTRGVTIVAVDDESGEFIYGKENVQESV